MQGATLATVSVQSATSGFPVAVADSQRSFAYPKAPLISAGDIGHVAEIGAIPPTANGSIGLNEEGNTTYMTLPHFASLFDLH